MSKDSDAETTAVLATLPVNLETAVVTQKQALVLLGIDARQFQRLRENGTVPTSIRKNEYLLSSLVPAFVSHQRDLIQSRDPGEAHRKIKQRTAEIGLERLEREEALLQNQLMVADEVRSGVARLLLDLRRAVLDMPDVLEKRNHIPPEALADLEKICEETVIDMHEMLATYTAPNGD